MTVGLARITVHTPHRRLDVAMPDQVPVAELLPELLRHAGDGLADLGEGHGGWVLRRADGAALEVTEGLHQQGVYDGEVLHLAPARLGWPEPEYDDVVETIAAGARRRGAAWSPEATRLATLAVAGAALATGLVALAVTGPDPAGWDGPAGLGVAAALLLAGVLAARAYGDARAGATLGGFALPYAFLGGALLVADPLGAPGPGAWLGAPQLLVATTALLLGAVLGAVGVAAGRRVFVAAMTIGAIGALAALAGYAWEGAGAAAVLAAVLVCGVGAVPLLAIRFGRLPMPPVSLPTGADPMAAEAAASPADRAWQAARERPDPAVVFAAVARSEQVLTGMLVGHAVLAVAAVAVLVAAPGFAPKLLAAVTALALVLRSRLFVTVRHRVPLLAGGVAGLVVLAAVLAAAAGPRWQALAVGAAVLVGLMVVAAGATWAARPPSPYLGRAVDIVDTLIVISVVPVAAAVLGLYAAVRDLAG